MGKGLGVFLNGNSLSSKVPILLHTEAKGQFLESLAVPLKQVQ